MRAVRVAARAVMEEEGERGEDIRGWSILSDWKGEMGVVRMWKKMCGVDARNRNVN